MKKKNLIELILSNILFKTFLKYYNLSYKNKYKNKCDHIQKLI